MAPRTAFLAAVIVAACLCAAAASDVINTQYGPVVGTHTDTYRQWLGIPYAASTAPPNRFQPPKEREPWTGIRDATHWGPGCPQFHHNPDVPKNQSEDCLNLNVWTPVYANSSTRLPVMIFFHGGAFDEGSNRGPFNMYDSSYNAGHKPVIIITANYRLTAFGWLTQGAIKGNQGLQDQIMALKWIQNNIANFGGDKTQVTLWGESAGAMSAGIHLVSPGSAGLFNKVIMESNPSGFRYRSEADNSIYGKSFCDSLNCTSNNACDLECLQHAQIEDIHRAWSKAGNNYIDIALANWGHWLDAFLMCTPTVDGDLVPLTPIDAIKAGMINKDVSVLLGTNNNEGSTFIYAALHDKLPTVLVDLALDAVFEDKAKDVANFYKNITSGLFDDGRTLLSRVLTDYWFRCASEKFASGVTAKGSKAFVYRYDHIFSDAELFVHFGLPAICANRTCHASELPFVFHFDDVHQPGLNVTMTPVEVALSNSFLDYWTSFAIHGDPNIGNDQKVTWPTWSESRFNIILEDEIDTESSLPLCSFWDTVGYDH